MSTSGKGTGYVKAGAGRAYMLGGEAGATSASPTAGSLRLYPVLIPFATAVVSFSFNVTTAGAAGSTLTPVFYGLDANGNPLHPVLVGNPVDTSAIAFATAAFAGTIPAGRLWAGGLALSPGAAPTVTSIGRSDQDPRGSLTPVDANGVVLLPFQSGLAAMPDPFAGTYIGGSAPLLYCNT